MKSLAIIGSGVSGIGAAYYLKGQFKLTVFEKNSYVGGHVNTIQVEEEKQTFPVDTGFIVYNETTYPRLVRFFEELSIETETSNMSFSCYNMINNLQWAGTSFNHLFAQRKNIFNRRYWSFLKEINRFNQYAPLDLKNLDADITLFEYARENQYSTFFLENFVMPMGSAVWSIPIEKIMLFPAKSFIQFFYNHGFLGLNTQFQWRFVKDGSNRYIKKIINHLDAAILTNEKVTRLIPQKNYVELFTSQKKYKFDKVLVATHANEALKILPYASKKEEKLLGSFRYQKNKALLHKDSSVMPPLRKIWSSWNYKLARKEGSYETSTVYYMNLLQNLKTNQNYFVSINEMMPVQKKYIIREIDYEHPIFDVRAVKAQENLPELNQEGPIYFSGSYFRYGFHEDGLWSALEAVSKIGGNSN